MTEGEALANSLRSQMTRQQLAFATTLTLPKLEAFIIGMFWDHHSRVALYNAAQHLYEQRSR